MTGPDWDNGPCPGAPTRSSAHDTSASKVAGEQRGCSDDDWRIAGPATAWALCSASPLLPRFWWDEWVGTVGSLHGRQGKTVAL